jgi:polyisoprenoid-binding protein YceI
MGGGDMTTEQGAGKSCAIDPAHSQIHIEMDHLSSVSTLRLRLTGISGTLTREDGGKRLLLEANIDATTLSAGLKGDPVFRSEAMFDVERYPTMLLRFEIQTTGPAPVKGHGDLQFRGVANGITVDVDRLSDAHNKRLDKPVYGIRASVDVRRSDWGMDPAVPANLSDAIRFVLNLEAIET